MCCSPHHFVVQAATHYHTRAWQTLIFRKECFILLLTGKNQCFKKETQAAIEQSWRVQWTYSGSLDSSPIYMAWPWRKGSSKMSIHMLTENSDKMSILLFPENLSEKKSTAVEMVGALWVSGFSKSTWNSYFNSQEKKWHAFNMIVFICAGENKNFKFFWNNHIPIMCTKFNG